MMKSLADIIKSKARLSPMMKGVLAAGAIGIVNDFILSTWGEEGEKLARAVYIKNTTLYIACLSSIMAQEIKMREEELKKIVNTRCGTDTIRKVRYLS